MKSPAELELRLRRQWENATLRETRLLGGQTAWPIELSIGRPAPRLMASDLDTVKTHVQTWRSVRIGKIIWEPVAYRAVAEPVQMPIRWQLESPSQWVQACSDRAVREEFEALTTLAEQCHPSFHPLLIRQRSLWRSKALAEVVQATKLAELLEPQCAQGKPLRTLSLAGIDTKFFERNARLVTALLDVRFDQEVSRIGLETFLDALSEGDHWILVIDLDGKLLPFRKQRVPSADLENTPLPSSRVLIVENEQCQHQLPPIKDTIAVFGSGFDLSWTSAPWLQEKQVGYWGDIDTWGLQFLAKARTAIPHLEPLLMTPELFQQHAATAVPEPVTAGNELPTGLTPNERKLYQTLLSIPQGRLEQEFLPEQQVHGAIATWAGLSFS